MGLLGYRHDKKYRTMETANPLVQLDVYKAPNMGDVFI
jgi:hypothetical protein